MLNKTNLLCFILYIRMFILLITLVALFLHLWGEGHIYAGNQGKEKQTQRKCVDISLQTPAYMFNCNCNAPLQYLLAILKK